MNTSTLNSMHLQSHQRLKIASATNSIMLWILWILFLATLAYTVYTFPNISEITLGNVIKVNGFTLLIWSTVTFFSAITSTFSRTYLKGFRYHSKFSWLSLGFTLSVMTLVASNNIILLVASWVLMGVLMAQLIGVDTSWGEAQQAKRYALRFFLLSGIMLGIGSGILAVKSESLELNGILQNLNTIPSVYLFISAMMIITAALIQSAIFPFHRWLLSAMTAPTPASAQMHAGFVNGSGILLSLFATLLFLSDTLNILFIIGGLTAIAAQFTKLLQVTVKQKLACSTIAQMGFMIMQCGLGFFNAAIAHLILHGFYKAYLFFSSGETIEMSQPEKQPTLKITFSQSLLVLIYGTIGAGLFVLLTGKGSSLDSSIFLTLIVAITVGQLTYNIIKEKSLNSWRRIATPVILFAGGIVVYALFFNMVTFLMKDMQMVATGVPLTVVHIVFGIIFLIGFFIMKLGIYQKVPWLYVKFLNASQPYKKTILTFKQKS